MTKESLLFALVRMAVFGENPREGMAEACTPDCLEEVYTLARSHDLAHLAAVALETLELPECGALEAFRQAKKLAVRRYIKLDFEYVQACGILEAAGIPYIPLKGSVIRDLYPEPWMRTSCDIDILVPEQELDRAVAALEQKKWTVKGTKNYHDISLFSPKGVHLELHFNIRENMEKLDPMLDKVWEYSSLLPGKRWEYRQSPEYLMFHVLAHMSYHFLRGGCGIRAMVDIRLIKDHLGYDEQMLRKLCRACGLETFYGNILQLADVWFGNENHNDATRAMEQIIVSGGTYGAFANAVSLRNAQAESRSRHILRRIFMPYYKLCAEYKILEKYRWLTPFCQVLRWLRLLNPKKLKHSLRELALTRQSRGEQLSETQELLKRIGLYEFE